MEDQCQTYQLLITVISYTIPITYGTFALWGRANLPVGLFYDKLCYPTFVVRILIDINVYPTTNHMKPLDFK